MPRTRRFETGSTPRRTASGSWNWSSPLPNAALTRSSSALSGSGSPSPALHDVIVYGTVALDRFVRVDAAGEPLPGSPIREMPGGEAFNTATALAGWGARVLLTGTALGSDEAADRLRALLDDPDIGLSRDWIPNIPSAVTPVCTVRVFPDGERAMSGRGFDRAVAPPPLPKTALAGRPVFAVCPNLGAAASAAALTAAEKGCPVVAMDFLDDAAVLRAARIVLTSAERLPRSPRLADVAGAPERAAARLVEWGAPVAIVTMGAEGCVVAARKEGTEGIVVRRQPAFRIAGIVDTTGAGDMFRAGLCWGLLRRRPAWPLSRAVRFASAAAAIHCTQLGGGSRPPLEAVLALAGRG